MRIFIPDIGTKLKLLQPWSFTLFHESRNDALMAAMVAPILGRAYVTGDEVYRRHYQEDEAVFGTYRTPSEPDYMVTCCGAERVGVKNRHDYPRCPVCEKQCTSYTHRWPEDRDTVFTKAQLGMRYVVGRLDGLAMQFPKNTELTIDRVYIRKGAKDFSSISFILRSTDHPDLIDKKGKQCFGRKGFRFWAALGEVNHMDAEVQV